jgi:hypothetical protein
MIENLQILQCCLFGKISPTGDPKKKKPTATSKMDFLLKTFKKFAMFLRKKRKNSPDLDSESV